MFGEAYDDEDPEEEEDMDIENIPNEAKEMPKLVQQMLPPLDVIHKSEKDEIRDKAAQAGIKLGSVYDMSESDFGLSNS